MAGGGSNSNLSEKLLWPLFTSLFVGVLLLSIEYRSGFFQPSGGTNRSETPVVSNLVPGNDQRPPTSPTNAVASPITSQQSAPAQPGVYTLDVYANQGWQDTNLYIKAGAQVKIEYVAGRWFEDPPGQWHDAAGGPNPWTCTASYCHELLHDFPKYALIGKIGASESLLQIGNSLVFIAEASDKLYLRPNYGDVDIPIHNPQGAITVRVTVR